MKFYFAYLFLSISLASSVKAEPNRSDLQALQKKIQQQQSQLKSKDKQKEKLYNDIKKTEIALSSQQKKINRIIEKNNELKLLMKEQAKEIETLDKNRQIAEDEVKETLRAQYRLLNESKLKHVFSGSHTQASQLQYYGKSLNESQLKIIQRYESTLSSLKKKQFVLKTSQTQAKKEEQKLKIEQTKQKNQLSQRSSILDDLNQTIKHDKDRLSQLKEDQKRLEQLIETIEKEIITLSIPSSKTPFHKMKGRLIKPLDPRNIRKTIKQRKGIQFKADIGKPIKSIYSGQVIFSGWFRGKGLLMIIDHGNAYMSLYAHNETLLFEVGDWVNTADNIATVGNSGGLDKSELYFEIRHKGKAVNPSKWLKR